MSRTSFQDPKNHTVKEPPVQVDDPTALDTPKMLDRLGTWLDMEVGQGHADVVRTRRARLESEAASLGVHSPLCHGNKRAEPPVEPPNAESENLFDQLVCKCTHASTQRALHARTGAASTPPPSSVHNAGGSSPVSPSLRDRS